MNSKEQLMIRSVLSLMLIIGPTYFSIGLAAPLHEAARTNDLDRISELITQGMAINSKDEGGHTALYLAAREGHLAVLELLVRNGGDVNFTSVNDGWTPLISTAYRGHENIVEFLVDHGAKIDAKDNDGYTALSWA